MPSAPLKVCAKPNCGKLTKERYCATHKLAYKEREVVKKREYDQLRGTRTERGYNNCWVKYSKLFRDKNPLCKHCKDKGHLKPSTCVDHIIPVEGSDDPLFWDETNHQALCWSCHSIKTAREDGGYNNRVLRSI